MRTTRVLSITLPEPMLLATQELARQENRTMSELVREALRRYQRHQLQQGRWASLAELGAASALQAGVRNEEDVVDLVRSFRNAKAAVHENSDVTAGTHAGRP